MNTRETSLIQAELQDALQDYSSLFRDRAELEIERADEIINVLVRMQTGRRYAESDIDPKIAADFARRYRVLDMRQQEKHMQITRLLVEIGEL